jgi:hypothetical protein
VDWYYKAAIVVALIWATARALGVYGEASRELDLSFLISFMLTMGGWAAVFLIVDRVAKFLGWKREATVADAVGPAEPISSPTVPTAAASAPTPSKATRRTARRSRR